MLIGFFFLNVCKRVREREKKTIIGANSPDLKKKIDLYKGMLFNVP